MASWKQQKIFSFSSGQTLVNSENLQEELCSPSKTFYRTPRKGSLPEIWRKCKNGKTFVETLLVAHTRKRQESPLQVSPYCGLHLYACRFIFGPLILFFSFVYPCLPQRGGEGWYLRAGGLFMPTGCWSPPPPPHLNKYNSTPPLHWDRRAIWPNLIINVSRSALAQMWTPPVSEMLN